MTSVLSLLVMAAAAWAVGASSFVSWRLELAGLSAPPADWGALLLCGLVPLWLVLHRRPLLAPPAGRWALLFFALSAVSALFCEAPRASLYEWLRKGVFSYIAYAGALVAALSSLPRPWLARGVMASTLLMATIGLLDTPGRVGAMGWTSPRGIAGLAVNHKMLAVALAPQLPLLGWACRHAGGRRWMNLGRLALLLGLLWIALSFSRSAWIIALCAGLLQLGRGSDRQRLGLVLAASLLLAGSGGWLSLQRSDAIGDAASARASLIWRAGQLVRQAPLLGNGPGASVRYEADVWPHLRVNGVEAHGVLQKVAAEGGALGLLAWLALATGLISACGRGPRGPRDSMVLLHLMLLFSTEAFTSSHWAVVGLCLSASMPARGPPPGRSGLWGLWAGSLLLLAVLVGMLRSPVAAVERLSVRAAILAFEETTGATGPEPGGTRWEPRECLWNHGPEGVAAVCSMVQRRADGTPLTREEQVEPGLYVLQKTGAGLEVIAVDRPGLQRP